MPTAAAEDAATAATNRMYLRYLSIFLLLFHSTNSICKKRDCNAITLFVLFYIETAVEHFFGNDCRLLYHIDTGALFIILSRTLIGYVGLVLGLL